MATEIASAVVALIPSFKGGSAAIEKELDQVGEKAGKKSGGRFGKVFASATMSPLRAVGAAAVGLFAIDKVKDFFGSAISEAREGQKVSAVTAQVIKATGGAAKLSAEQVGALSTELSNKTGIDDEVIQSGANLLLTFKNVKNEVGEGNDVFKRATSAAADLSAAGFGSVEGASLQLGKALNDPIKGIAALSRSGVTFTAQQKEQIKTLTESGKTLEAQKIILGEVEAQVGGTAAASATAGEKFAVAFGNFKEEVGAKLLPILDQVLGAGSKLFPVFLQIGDTIGKVVGPILAQVGETLKSFFGQLQVGGGTASQVGETLKSVFGTIGAVIGGIFKTAGPILSQIAKALREAFIKNAPAIRSAMTSIREIVVGVLGIVQVAWKRLGPIILPIIKSVFGTIVNVISGALKIVSGVVKLVLSLIKGDWKGAGEALKKIWSGLWQIVTSILRNAGNILKSIFGGIVKAAGTSFSNMASSIGRFVGSIPGRITGALRSLGGTIANLFSRAFSQARNAVGTGIDNITRFVRSIPGRITGAIGNLGSTLYNAGRDVISGFINGLASAAGRIRQAVQDFIISKLPGPVRKALGIGSPSKVFRKIGQQTGDGLVLGLKDSARNVQRQLTGLTGGIAADASLGLDGSLRPMHIGSVTISAETVEELKNVIQFFEVVEHEARRMAPNMPAGQVA
jgi:hypothetical protein